MINYVVGFAFDKAPEPSVVLIKKNKGPAYVVGKLNGVGGKMEGNENPQQAMFREFGEETGLFVPADQWVVYHTMSVLAKSERHMAGDALDTVCTITFLKTFADSVQFAHTKETEEVTIGMVAVVLDQNELVPNLYWLIPLALDTDQCVGPSYSTAKAGPRDEPINHSTDGLPDATR